MSGIATHFSAINPENFRYSDGFVTIMGAFTVICSRGTRRGQGFPHIILGIKPRNVSCPRAQRSPEAAKVSATESVSIGLSALCSSANPPKADQVVSPRS